MATFNKRGKRWTATVRLTTGSRSKTFDTKVEARSWANDTEHLMRNNAGLAQGKTLGDAFIKYAQEIAPIKKGARWEVIRLAKLGRDDIAFIPLLHLTTLDLELWRDRSLVTLKSSSVNRELNIISSVIEVARKQWRWIGVNPLKELDRPKDPPHRDRRISDDEIQRICDALLYDENEPVTTQRQHIAVAFLLAIETAMRQGELFTLDWQDVHLDQLFVHLKDTKNGTKRDVPLSSRAKVLVEKLRPASAGNMIDFNQRSCGQIFRRAVRLCGIEDLTFHDTRHEALTRLARRLDLLDLARMVGHRDPRSLMIYYNATATEIAGRLG